jgi:hypothetical protein
LVAFLWPKKIFKLPSEFLAKLGISLNIRHQILLDCYIYDWSAKLEDGNDEREAPKGLDQALADLINATKQNCVQFRDFMKKNKVGKFDSIKNKNISY